MGLSKTPGVAAPDNFKSIQPATVSHVTLEKSHQQIQGCDSHSAESLTSFTSAQRPAKTAQVLAGIVVAIAQLGSGCATTYAGATITALTSSNSTDITLSEYTTPLFASLVNVGGMVGSMISGFMMVGLGPRVTTLVILPAWLSAWIMIYFANSVHLLLVSMFFVGVTKGVFENTPYTYMVEIAYKEYRGALNGVIDVFRALGIIFMYGIGALPLTWRQLALVVGFVTSTPTFIGLFFFHDSPRWLASKGYFEKAYKSLEFFRGRQFDIGGEYKEICEQAKGGKIDACMSQQLEYLKDVSILKRLGVLVMMVFLCQWGGNTAVLSYAAIIFNKTGSCTNANVCSIAVGVGRTLGAVVLLISADYVGRRLSFIVPVLICSLSTFTLGVYFYIKTVVENGEEFISLVSWLPVVTVFIFGFNMSWVVAVFSVLPGEIFPLVFRSMGKGIAGTISNLFKFGVVMSFPILTGILDYYTVFWIFSFCGAASALTPFFLPETRGRSLEEIERYFTSKNNRV